MISKDEILASAFRKCEGCKRKPYETTANYNGEIYFFCKRCYERFKYGK